MSGRRIAVIPARGGSKRIPRKNIKPFHGRPMLAWPIAAAKASGLFDRIVVSTEDAEIAQAARAEGAQTPFVRPAELASDTTATVPVIRHAVEALGAKDDWICLIYPTAVFVQAAHLREGVERLAARPDKAFALSVASFESAVQRALTIGDDNGLEPLYPQYRDTRSQDLQPAFHDAGQFCWGRGEAWISGPPVHSSAALPVIIPRHLVQDIDTEEDWRRAELMFGALRAQAVAS